MKEQGKLKLSLKDRLAIAEWALLRIDEIKITDIDGLGMAKAIAESSIKAMNSRHALAGEQQELKL